MQLLIHDRFVVKRVRIGWYRISATGLSSGHNDQLNDHLPHVLGKYEWASRSETNGYSSVGRAAEGAMRCGSSSRE